MEGTHKWLPRQQDPILPDERTELQPEELDHYHKMMMENKTALRPPGLRGRSVGSEVESKKGEDFEWKAFLKCEDFRSTTCHIRMMFADYMVAMKMCFAWCSAVSALMDRKLSLADF